MAFAHRLVGAFPGDESQAMNTGFDRSPRSQQGPQMPSAFFDGIELGLEATMFSILAIAIPASAHVGLSATLGYAVRYTDGVVLEPRSFSLFGFLSASLLAFVAITMAMFSGIVIPTMLYSAGLVAYMLRWLGKRRGHVRRASIILGCALGLAVGVLLSIVGFLLLGLRPAPKTYATLFHWPEILTIDGIALLWFTVLPAVTAVAGYRTGQKIAGQLEALTMHWFWY
jgi:hypothetical protein